MSGHSPSQDQDLRTALEPFADLISTIEKEAADSRIFTIAGFGPSRKAITVGHIRRAHAVLTPAQAPDKAGEREGLAETIRSADLSWYASAAAKINDSPALMSVYAAPEWDCLSEDGQQWVCALVRETLAMGAETPEFAPVRVSINDDPQWPEVLRMLRGLSVKSTGARKATIYGDEARLILAALTPSAPIAAPVQEPITDDGEAGASIALRVVQRICEFDDRTSPDDQPDMMLVTGQELTDLIEEEVSRYWPEPAAPVRDDGARERARCAHIAKMHCYHSDQLAKDIANSIAACIRDPDYVLRDLETQQPLASLPAPAGDVPGEAPRVDVHRMRLSGNRTDYFVRIRCGDRDLTPHVFRERWKAEYEVAQWQYLFGQRPVGPEFSEFTETTHPNDDHDRPGEAQTQEGGR